MAATVVDRFELQGLVGKGGMGEVWRAREVGTGTLWGGRGADRSARARREQRRMTSEQTWRATERRRPS